MDMNMVLIAAIMATEGVLCAAAGALAVWMVTRERTNQIHAIYRAICKS